MNWERWHQENKRRWEHTSWNEGRWNGATWNHAKDNGNPKKKHMWTWDNKAGGSSAAAGTAWKQSKNASGQGLLWKHRESWASTYAAYPWDKKENESGDADKKGDPDWDNKAGWNGAAASTPWQQCTKVSAQHYWATQKCNLEHNQLWQPEMDDKRLFTKSSSAVTDVRQCDKIPVEVWGRKCQKLPICDTFELIYNKFNDRIPEALLNNVKRCDYTIPTPIQKYAIPFGFFGRDVMCCAQTGSGKICAFLLPMIGRMMRKNHKPIGGLRRSFQGPCDPYTLILTPTREQGIQIYEEACKFADRTPYRVAHLYGPDPVKQQLEDICKGADLMVACPERFANFLDCGVIAVDKVWLLVLDDADHMLHMGFETAVRAIVEEKRMPPKDERHTMMFSATFSEPLHGLAAEFLYEYIWIGVGIMGAAANTVTQTVVRVTPQDKDARLIQVLDDFYTDREKQTDGCLIFVDTVHIATWLDKHLYERNFDTGVLHENLTQAEREKNMTCFRTGAIDVLVATDVGARGLAIEPNVTTVVNYDLPQDIDTYVHRIGRNGRIGKKATSIALVAVTQPGYSQLPAENPEALRVLHKAMEDAKSDIPPWLVTLLESGPHKNVSDSVPKHL